MQPFAGNGLSAAAAQGFHQYFLLRAQETPLRLQLRFLLRLMEKVRKAIEEDRLLDLRRQFYERYDMSRNF